MFLPETVENVPSGLIACRIGGEQKHIAAISPRDLWLRTAGDVPTGVLEVRFCDQKSGTYDSVEISEYETGEVRREGRAALCRFIVSNGEYASAVRRTMRLYARLVELKSEFGMDAVSGEFAGFSMNDTYCSSVGEQYARWFGGLPEYVRLRPAQDQRELAVQLADDAMVDLYLRCGAQEFMAEYARAHRLPSGFLPTALQRLYVGNPCCGLLFPDARRLESLMKKADREKIKISFVTADLREYPLERMAEYGGELVVNDWGMLWRAQAFRPALEPVLGVLLNKRRKDPRIRFKTGYEQRRALLAENTLNEPMFREYLKDLGIERFEFESSGTPLDPPDAPCSLHLPFYLTNASAYCTLRAYIETGDRGRQRAAQSCPKYCGQNAFLYPENLKMIGRYNALLALNDDFEHLLPSGFDRIVLNF